MKQQYTHTWAAVLAAILAAALALILSACTGSAPAALTPEKTNIHIAGLKGPTSMGLVKLMEESENGGTAGKYSFSLHGSADEVTPKLIQGELDLAAVPANLAAVLYNSTDGAVRVLAVNTLGVLYIVEKGNSVQSLEDLRGKTIYATGKGSTPEYTLRYILQENSLDPDTDVTIEFKAEPTEAVSALAAQGEGIAMLPQPYVTAAQAKIEGLRTVLDLTEAWDSLNSGSRLITGVLVGRTDFIEKNPDAVNAFLEEYRASVDWVLTNTEAAAALIEKYDIAKAAIAGKALPFCNITFLAGKEMKEPLSGYLRVLYEQNPKAVGGRLPGEDFYYGGS